MVIEQRIESLGITLPPPPSPAAMYVPVKQMGNALYISGQLPLEDGKLAFIGKAGGELTLEEAQQAARLCIINMLAVVKRYLGDLDRVKNVIKLQAFVNSSEGFDQQHIVVNAASQLLFGVFGEIGRHARSAVGTNQLPMNATVEIEAIFEI